MIRSLLPAWALLVAALPSVAAQGGGAPTTPGAATQEFGSPGSPFASGTPFESALVTAVEHPQPMMMRLRSGQVLLGSIEAHDPERVHFRRLDNGGLVRLPWSLLDPGQEGELRLDFGYVEVQNEELLVTADKIPLLGGEELIGMIVNRTDDALHVKTAQTLMVLPKGRVAGPSTLVQVPALDVFTREELYQKKLEEHREALLEETPEAALLHREVAEYCERILDYAHALHHYRRATELDPGLDPELLRQALVQAERKAEAQEQVDYLAEVRLLTARNQFNRALTLCEEFPLLYPQSPLVEDWLRARDTVLRHQEQALREEIVRRWHFWAARHAQRAARELGYREARDWVAEKMTEEVLASVHADVLAISAELDPATTRSLFDQREGGRWRKVTYGIGTWLLGEGDARRGLDPEPEVDAAQKDPERARLEERIRRYLENQEARRRSQNQAEGEDPEVFWQAYGHASRAQWILAYYAEHAGDMRLRDPQFRNCHMCGGTGVREVIHSGAAVSGSSAANSRLVRCPTCHQIGIVRRVSYR